MPVPIRVGPRSRYDDRGRLQRRARSGEGRLSSPRTGNAEKATRQHRGAWPVSGATKPHREGSLELARAGRAEERQTEGTDEPTRLDAPRAAGSPRPGSEPAPPAAAPALGAEPRPARRLP